MQPCIVTLGRHGDILNSLGIAWEIFSRTKQPVGFLVAQEFASTLDGASYVRPIQWPGDYSQLQPAVERIRSGGWLPVLAQAYGSPAYEERRTQSYQREAWRVAGMLEHFGTMPLVLDQRDPERESELVKKVLPDSKPFILLCSSGVSSPIPKLNGLADTLRAQLPGHTIIDLATVRAHRVYDLLGLMDRAALLVSVDTVHLHLARAASCPVIAILNDGWRGSEPPPATVASFRYADVTSENVASAAHAFLHPPARKVFHAVNPFGATERHQRARASWATCYEAGMIPAPAHHFARSARDIGDEKALPYLQDILAPARELAGDDDVIVWTNDDVTLDPRIVSWAGGNAGAYGAATMRRDEPGHCGRELFAFTKRWLVETKLPDFLIGTHQFDLAVAAIVRHRRGIWSNLRNIGTDFYPCDTSERFALHEPHKNEWESRTEHPSGRHNAALFSDWLSGQKMFFWTS